jgi:hypothetical protein
MAGAAAVAAAAAPGTTKAPQGAGKGKANKPAVKVKRPLHMPKAPRKPSTEKKKRRFRKKLCVCLDNCKYELVARVSSKLGFHAVAEDEAWNLHWIDTSVSIERVMRMKKFQKINHFPGMTEICRKDLLSKNLGRMQKMFPQEYAFLPASFSLPAEANELRSFVKKKKTKLTLIVKPNSGCQGKGIYLTSTCDNINMSENNVVQTYVRNPLLIDGLKFDLRIYALVLSCDPLRIFIFKEGLARFATNPYVKPTEANIHNTFMHLTNYSLNKHSDGFVPDGGQATAPSQQRQPADEISTGAGQPEEAAGKCRGDDGVTEGAAAVDTGDASSDECVGESDGTGRGTAKAGTEAEAEAAEAEAAGAGSEGSDGESSEAGDDDSARETASKRTIESVMTWLREHGHDDKQVWARIGALINMTLIAIQPKLAHAYRTCFPRGEDSDNNCFEILGFDVLLDSSLKPWLIEVNHSPSFNTDAPIDERCKSALIEDTLRLVNIKSSAKRNYTKQLRAEFARRNFRDASAAMAPSPEPRPAHQLTNVKKQLASEEACRGGFTRIFPRDDNPAHDQLFRRLFAGATMIFTGQFRTSEGSSVYAQRIAQMCEDAAQSSDDGEEGGDSSTDEVALVEGAAARRGFGGRAPGEAAASVNSIHGPSKTAMTTMPSSHVHAAVAQRRAAELMSNPAGARWQRHSDVSAARQTFVERATCLAHRVERAERGAGGGEPAASLPHLAGEGSVRVVVGASHVRGGSAGRKRVGSAGRSRHAHVSSNGAAQRLLGVEKQWGHSAVTELRMRVREATRDRERRELDHSSMLRGSRSLREPVALKHGGVGMVGGSLGMTVRGYRTESSGRVPVVSEAVVPSGWRIPRHTT